jgi:magnesium-transporting ATPase (P-type)
MGFQDAVLDEFSLVSSRCAEEGTKCAFYELIVKEKESGSGNESAEEPEGQVLISGSSEAILAQCTEFFSGANIEELDSTTVSSIQHQCGHWLREEDLVPIAFAYRPLQRDNEPIDASSGSVGPPSEREGDLDVSRTDNPTACRSPTPQIHPSPSSDNVVFDDVPTIQTPLPPRHLSLEDVTVEEAPRAHAPCTSEDDAEPSPRIIPHILTGLLALGLRPRSSTPSFIDILSDCGIRFVFFCEENERRTKAFGAKLGLETGWNSCISLEASADVILLDDSDLKAHLPHGVASIVEHLDRTDDVPLKVSLFCDSRPDASADMVGIYQQNAEIVCCLGNVVSLRYLPVFLAADIAIGAAPYFLQDLTRPPQASVMFQLPHPRFYESATLSLYEARRVMNNVVLARSAWLAVLAFLLCFLTIVAALGVPPPLRGYEVLWLVCIVLPLLILPLVNTDVDPAILQTLQSKNRNVEHPGHYVTSFAVRFVPTAIFMSFVYVWLLQNMSDSSISYSDVMWQRNTYANEGSLVRDVEAVVLWLIVYYCVFLVSGFLHRTKSLTEFPAWKANRTWLAFAIFVLGIQSLYSGMLARGSLKNISVALYVTTLVGWPAVILLGTRYMKRVDAAIFRDYQKHLKIDFTTRLGMHSPV